MKTIIPGRYRRGSKSILTTALIALCVLGTGAERISGAQEAHPGGCHLNMTFMQDLASDFSRVMCSPLGWKGDDFIAPAAVLGTGAILFLLDRDIKDWVDENRSPASEGWARIFNPMGHGCVIGGLIAGMYASGEIFREEGLRRTALLSLESWLISSGAVWGLKAVAGRARPYVHESGRCFRPFSFTNRYWSLPSGHSASLFAVAAVIADESDQIVIDGLVYTLAVLGSLSRVHENKHWLSDVLLGSAIGYGVGKKICALHRRRRGKDLVVDVNMNLEGVFLTLQYSF